MATPIAPETITSVHKAHPITEASPVAPAILRIELYLNDDPKQTLAQARETYVADATTMEQIFHDTLPGGTYSELLRAMLLRRASHFRVAFGAVHKEG